MRRHFEEDPWDLYVGIGSTAVMTSVLLGVGTLLAILHVLFAPGYIPIAALFPRGP